MRLEPRAVLVGALLVCACVAPQLALGDSSGRSDGRDWNEPSTAPPPHPPNFDDALAPELARIERQHAERRTEGARRMRERSRTAYAALSGPDALDLARQQFPSVFESPIWRGPEAPPGGRIRRFLSDHSYLVDQPNGPTELVQSLDPVLDKDAAGHDAPIDTRLHQSANGFAPANTLTPVQVAGDAAGSSSLERAGIAFHLVGGDPARAQPLLATRPSIPRRCTTPI